MFTNYFVRESFISQDYFSTTFHSHHTQLGLKEANIIKYFTITNDRPFLIKEQRWLIYWIGQFIVVMIGASQSESCRFESW